MASLACWLLLLVVIALSLGYIWYMWGQGSVELQRLIGMPSTLADRGLWGDSFGGLNTLFAGLGFSAVAVTLILQIRQNKFLADDQHKQRFDSSFFILLNLLKEARSEVEHTKSDLYFALSVIPLPNNKASKKGIAAFSNIWEEIAVFAARLNIKNPTKNNSNELGVLYKENIHDAHDRSLGPYFRLVYTIISRIDRDRVLSEEEKITYGNLFRSLLSSPELAVIGVNALSSVSGNLKDYLIKYRLLKYIPEGSMKSILAQHYPTDAFLGRP